MHVAVPYRYRSAAEQNKLEQDQAWDEAIGTLAGRRRILVLGATDMGKSSFIRRLALARPELRLLDVDPGQKMIGPPGTVGLGTPDRLDRFAFVGTSSASALGAIARAAAALRAGAGPLVVNTAGFVTGLGARLQTITAAAIEPDALVLMGDAPALEPILAAGPRVIRLAPSPLVRRKSPSERRRIRQAAFTAALHGAAEREIEAELLPGPAVPFEGAARPVCALAADAEDRGYGLLLAPGRVLTCYAGPATAITLGKLWAQPHGEGWTLLDPLRPAWAG